MVTLDDLRKIETWLHHRTVKDTQLEEVVPLNGTEVIPVLQDGKNRLMPLYVLTDTLRKTDITDLYNVTGRYDLKNIPLEVAITAVPSNRRKIGLVITFIDPNNNWQVIQFKGESLNQWHMIKLWKTLFEGDLDAHVYIPDEEDLTGKQDGNRKIMSLKDREYDPAQHSGKGFKILRKHLVGLEACSVDDEDHYLNELTQEDFNETDTVYIVRYDFNLKGAITLPENSELFFEGGTLNGTEVLNLNGAKLVNMVGFESDYIKGCNVMNWHKGQIEYRQVEEEKMHYWTGEEWKPIGDVPLENYYTKEEVDNLLESYAKSEDVYNKEEADNKIHEYVDQKMNELKQQFNSQLQEMKNGELTLDKVQAAINSGCGVNMKMPTANGSKISLPIWTGSKAEYDRINPKVSGMTYNIVD